MIDPTVNLIDLMPMLADSTGKGLLDLNRVEYLCPICRRLANVVLPVVDASILSKKELAQEDVKGGDKIREELKKFWHLNNNLEKAVDFFSTQASCWTNARHCYSEVYLVSRICAF